jgi:glycosyltransferase involved in cell wall biosynthesis
MELIDVIILANNKSEEHYNLTSVTIDSLRKNTEANLNIIIVESNPDALDIFEDCKIVKPNKKFNYGEFVNIGYNYCYGDWVMILNNDLEFTPGWWKEIKKVYDSNSDIKSFAPYEPNFHGGYYWGYFNSEENIYQGYSVPYRVSGWCMIHRREILDRIGHFDPRFDFYFIDDDYGKRLEYHGIPHVLVKSSVVYHKVSQSHDTIPSMVDQAAMDSAKKKFEDKWRFFNTIEDPKIKMVHLLLKPDTRKDIPEEMWASRIAKQNESIECWRRIAPKFNSFSELYFTVNREYLPSENCADPTIINHSKDFENSPPVLSYGHYGAYRAHSEAILNEFNTDADALLVVEGDVQFSCSPEEMYQIIKDSVKFGTCNNASLLTLGRVSYGTASRASTEDTSVDFGEHKKIDHFLCAQCYLIFKSERKSIQQKILTTGWHAWDIWLYWNYDRRVPIFATKKTLVWEPEGSSMIDYKTKETFL